MTLPAYIPTGGEQSLLPPGTLTSTQFYIFALKGQRSSLQALCDKYFNTPSGGQVDYRPLSDYVLLMFTHVDKLASADPARGWIAYHDIAIWVPMMAMKKTRRGTEIIERIVMYPPYIMVDSPATMVTGREVFGLPKEIGLFNMPQTPSYMGIMTTNVIGYRNQGEENLMLPLWQIRPSAKDAQNRELKTQKLNGGKAVINELSKLLLSDTNFPLPSPGIIKELFTGIPALGFKQFRDAADGTKACYQAIVEAPLRTTKINNAWLYLEPFEFTLFDLASHPVAQDLGLQSGTQQVEAALWLNLNVTMENGTIIWQWS